MQVKLWSQNESALKKIAAEPEYKSIGVSVAKIANLAISQYVISRKLASRPKKAGRG